MISNLFDTIDIRTSCYLSDFLFLFYLLDEMYDIQWTLLPHHNVHNDIVYCINKHIDHFQPHNHFLLFCILFDAEIEHFP